MQPPSVFTRLSQSNARLIACRDLGEGVALARWQNSRDRVRYENTRHHVLSLYTHDGTQSRRTDRQSGAGFPGAITLMPQGASSDWQIDGTFAFLHLYIPDAILRAFAAETLDAAPAAVDLPEITFAQDPALLGALPALAEATAPLTARAALNEVLHRLLAAPGWQGLRPARASGGLPPATLRRLRDHVDAHLDQPLRLADLAAVAGLSEFHFHRAFRATTGLTPQAFLDRARIARAEALITAATPLAEVAAACGFAHHSHLTRTFRKARGVTPSAWRAALA